MARKAKLRSGRPPGSNNDLSPLGKFDPADGPLLNRRSTLEWKLDQGTAWRGGSLEPYTGLTPPPVGPSGASDDPDSRASSRRQHRTDALASDPTKKGDTTPLPKRVTRLVWKNGMDVSDEFRQYAERVGAGEDLPPFQGNFLADPSQINRPQDNALLVSSEDGRPLLLGDGQRLRTRGPHPNPAKFSTSSLLAIVGLTTAAAAGVGFVLWTTASQAQHPLTSADWNRPTALGQATALKPNPATVPPARQGSSTVNRQLLARIEQPGSASIATTSAYEDLPTPRLSRVLRGLHSSATKSARIEEVRLASAGPPPTATPAAIGRMPPKEATVTPAPAAGNRSQVIQTRLFEPVAAGVANGDSLTVHNRHQASSQLPASASDAPAQAPKATIRPKLSLREELRQAVAKSKPRRRKKVVAIAQAEMLSENLDSQDLLLEAAPF